MSKPMKSHLNNDSALGLHVRGLNAIELISKQD